MLAAAAKTPKWFRLIAVVAMLAVLLVSAAAASPAHRHTTGPGDTCTVCQAAHASSHQALTPVALVVTLAVLHAVTEAAPDEHQNFLSSSALTRGPPSSTARA